MNLIEGVLILLMWAFQIGVTAVIALMLGAGAWALEQVLRKKKVKLWPRAVVAMVLLCAVLAVFALKPPVSCPTEYENRFTPELHQAVQSVSRGLYSYNVPLIPIHVEVTEIRDFSRDGEMNHAVEFTIHYLYLGRVEMMYSTGDGYSITKPLTGW